MTRIRILCLLAPAALLAAAPAHAQVGNQTDIPVGPIGAPSGGSYLGPGLRTFNEMFGLGLSGDPVYRNALIGCAVRTGEREFRTSERMVPRTASEERVLTLLEDAPGAPATEDVARALARGADPSSRFGRAAYALAAVMKGLMRDRDGCPDDRAAYPEAPQWEAAIRAFNYYIRIAPDAAFAPPAPELLEIHEALETVVTRALNRRP